MGIKSVQEVIKKYNECTLGKNDNPEEWIAKKDEIRMRLQIEYGKKDYEDNDFKVSVVYDLPEEYQAQKAILKDKYKSMALKQMVLMLRERYHKLAKDNNKVQEKALIVMERKRIKGKCFHCRKFGHPKEFCHNKNDGKPDLIVPGEQPQGQ